MRDSNPRGVAACLVSGEVHSATLPTLQTAAGLTDGGGKHTDGKHTRLSGAGSLFHVVLVESDPATGFRRVVLRLGNYGKSPVLQPGYDSSQFRCIEHLYCLLYRQPPARQQVGEDFALWITSHIFEFLSYQKMPAPDNITTNLLNTT